MAGEQFGNVYASVRGIAVMLMFYMNRIESIVLDQGKLAPWSVSRWLMGNGAHMAEDWQQDRQTHPQLGRNPWFPGIKSATVESKCRAPCSRSPRTETSRETDVCLVLYCSVQAVIVTSCRNSNGGHLSVGQTIEANRRVFENYPSSQPVK